MRTLFDKLLTLTPIRWQRVLEDSRVMVTILKKMVLLTLDGYTKEVCIAGYLFCKKVRHLVKGSGLLFTALYLKQCSSSLQTYYGGCKKSPELLPVPISLTRSGCPRIIPSFHRRMIYKRDDKADPLVKLYLSFFTLSKLIKLCPKISKKTFQSITQPDQVASFIGIITEKIPNLVNRYLPGVSTIPLNQGMKWVPTWKSLPTFKQMNDLLRQNAREQGIGFPFKGSIQSCFPAVFFELSAYTFLLEFIHSRGEQWSSGILWPERTRFALDRQNQIFSGSDLDQFEKTCGPQLPSYRDLRIPPITGRLGCTIEGGGKRRIFAIGNYINQRLLKPVHDWLMDVLRGVPMDGTFQQTAPLDRLAGKQDCYSFDLKSATSTHIQGPL